MIDVEHDRLVKVGGAELTIGPGLAELVRRVGDARRLGRRWVLVHGGGQEVTMRAAELGLPTSRHRGQRLTDAPMREVVVEVLAGRIGQRLVAALENAGTPAVGLSGLSGSLLEVSPEGEPPGSLGFVGRPRLVRPELIEQLLDAGYTPVIAPLGADRRGEVYNVNADLAAGAIAGALGIALAMVTDVPGLLGPDGTRLARLSPGQAQSLLARGVATDGMIPKLQGALAALRAGAPEAWIGPLAELGPDGPHPQAGTRICGSRALGRIALLPAHAEGLS